MIVKVYRDHGISGAKGRDKRPAFNKLCRDAARREFDMVMAWSVDRLGRSLQDVIGFLSERLAPRRLIQKPSFLTIVSGDNGALADGGPANWRSGRPSICRFTSFALSYERLQPSRQSLVTTVHQLAGDHFLHSQGWARNGTCMALTLSSGFPLELATLRVKRVQLLRFSREPEGDETLTRVAPK